MNLFLRAKHWQIFLLTFGLPFVFQIIMMINIFSSILNRQGKPVVMLGYFKFFPLMMVVFMGALFGWMWSVAMGLQKTLPAGVTMKTTQFKIFFFIPLVYICLFSFFITSVMSSFMSGSFLHGGQPDMTIFYFFPIIFPLHLFAMFCIFYCLYFVAKTIKTAELQKEATFSDFVGEFFLIWFHFIGIWILQPRINKLVEQYKGDLPVVGDNINKG